MQNNIMNKFFDFYMESIKNEETGVSKEDLVNKAVQGVANETGKTVEEISTIIVEELESSCEDAISELSPKDIQVAKCNNWIDWMDRLLIAESSLEAVAKARDDGKYRFLQISSDRVEVENVPLRKKLTFNFETLPTQEDAKLVLRELLMI